MPWGYRLKHSGARALEALLGRRNLVRLGSFLAREGRLDVPNNPAVNGEALVQQWLVQSIENGEPGVVVDVGASVGDWTLGLLRVAKKRGPTNLSVICFEPAPRSAQVLRQRIAAEELTAHVTVVEAAVSAEAGIGNLLIYEDTAGVNSLHPSHTGEPRETVAVPLLRLDDFLRSKNLERVLMLKVDAEGHDLRVLEGAREFLDRNAISVVQFEYNHRWIETRAYLRDVFDLLAPCGYHVGKVTPRGIEFYDQWDPELETFTEGNYLACTRAWSHAFPRVPWWRTTRKAG